MTCDTVDFHDKRDYKDRNTHFLNIVTNIMMLYRLRTSFQKYFNTNYLVNTRFNFKKACLYCFKDNQDMKRLAVSPVFKTEDIEDVWKTQVERIRDMRKVEDAPVDTMGCHKLADPLAPPEVFRFQVLLSLMLSSQTKDHITAAAIMRLREHGCTVDSMINIKTSELESLLCPVGFYKRKAVYIQKSAILLKEKFKGDIPRTLEDKLCSLPGVGPKMGHLVMQVAWGEVEGIAVDTHVHRIANRLGWMKTKNPEETRVKLQNMLPKEEWSKINPLLVGFGQQICLPIKPKCDTCLCFDICPASTAKKKMKIKVEEESHNEIKNEEKTDEDDDDDGVSPKNENPKLEVKEEDNKDEIIPRKRANRRQ